MAKKSTKKPPKEEEKIVVVKNERAEYNCIVCAGRGLVNNFTVCPVCKGTGKLGSN